MFKEFDFSPGVITYINHDITESEILDNGNINLTEYMLQVQYSNDITLDVGWYSGISKFILYVIVKSLEGYYRFPKGHMKDNETKEETAIREIYEETGLKVKIIPGFKTMDKHPIPNKEGVIKRIIYFPVEYQNQKFNYQKEELLGAYLMTYEEAMSIFQFESSKRVLNEVNDNIISLNASKSLN